VSTVHNPTNFNPADYEVVDYLDNRRPEYYLGMDLESWKLEVSDWSANLARVLGDGWQKKVHRCVHCGQTNVRWITAVLHVPTSETLVFGCDCTARLEFPDAHSFKLALLKSRAEKRTASLKVYREREAFFQMNPLVLEAYNAKGYEVHARNDFVQDVFAKLDKYGSLSVNQVSAVLKSMQRDVEYAAKRAVEALLPKVDAPKGRVDVTGVVLSLKWQTSDFGEQLKMVVKLDTGARVWVSAPGKYTLEVGDTVQFRATFEPSKDDASFAFGSRPHMIKHTPKVAQDAPAETQEVAGA
jgi:hypothetical protein